LIQPLGREPAEPSRARWRWSLLRQLIVSVAVSWRVCYARLRAKRYGRRLRKRTISLQISVRGLREDLRTIGVDRDGLLCCSSRPQPLLVLGSASRPWRPPDTYNEGSASTESGLTERYRSGRNGGASKASCPQGHVGSNPTLSANLRSLDHVSY